MYSQALLENAGKVAYGVYFFKTKKLISNHYEEPLISASIIKVFIMEYIYQMADPTVILQQEKIGDLVEKMITISDNKATNQLIDYYGFETLNNYFQTQGYRKTRLDRKMLDFDAQKKGLENYTSLADTLKFLQRLYEKQHELATSQMLAIMKRQKIVTKIRKRLPAVPIASKTGELDAVENDIGIVFSNNPFAIVVLSNQVIKNKAMEAAIADFAFLAFELSESSG